MTAGLQVHAARNVHDPRNVLRRYVTEAAQMPTTPQNKILGYVTLARNMPMPTPCFLVRLRYATEPAQVLPTPRYLLKKSTACDA